jgi:hypothetical protein
MKLASVTRTIIITVLIAVQMDKMHGLSKDLRSSKMLSLSRIVKVASLDRIVKIGSLDRIAKVASLSRIVLQKRLLIQRYLKIDIWSVDAYCRGQWR